MKFVHLGLLGAAVATAALFACSSAEIGDAAGSDGGVGLPDATLAPEADAAAGQPDAAVIDAAPSADAAPCDDGVLNAVDPLGGGCVMYFDTPVQWETARDRCLNLIPAGHLAAITSAEENAVIAAIPAGVDDVWLGGNDRVVEMLWAWVNAEPFIYDNWRDGEPNDGGDAGEDCMVMELDNGGTWDDRNCVNRLYGYVCER